MDRPLSSIDIVQGLLPDSACAVGGHLSLGGCMVADLADRYGTPLYVYDEPTLRGQARRVRAAFSSLNAQLNFAAKACCTPAILRILGEEGWGIDAVSEGEIQAALRAGIPPGRIHLHGNNKTPAELEAAVRFGLHAVVLDNLPELHRLETLCARFHKPVNVMLRIALPLRAETHPHLQTTGHRSKFGFARESAEEADALGRLSASVWLRFQGLHTHLGSQIEVSSVYTRAADQLLALAEALARQGLKCKEIGLGGGWAVAYRPGDAELRPEDVAASMGEAFADHPSYHLAVEPGRALVARAGVAVYHVGSVKSFGSARIVSVDGGMGDNPRPALYGARYSALLPGRLLDPPTGPTDVVGRFCESGDVLARDVPLPFVEPGDLLCIAVSGAYQLSMASAYNLVPQPVAVLVGEGRHRLITRRATIDDLLQREVIEPAEM